MALTFSIVGRACYEGLLGALRKFTDRSHPADPQVRLRDSGRQPRRRFDPVTAASRWRANRVALQ